MRNQRPGQGWLDGTPALTRGYVSTALGMLAGAFRVSPPNALALLRGAALSRNLTIDELATSLRSRRIGAIDLGDD